MRLFIPLLLVTALTAHAQTLTISTLAGSQSGGGYVDGSISTARFSSLRGIAFDSQGNVFIADRGNHTIRKISALGTVSTFAGQPGVIGSVDGTGNAASFNAPSAITVDIASDTIYVADTGNHTIRRITQARVVTTLAGKAGLTGAADGTGAIARFNTPRGVAVDAVSGTIYVTDSANQTIRAITRNGVVSTFAGRAGSVGSADGTGAGSRFNTPYGIAVDVADGSIIVADAGNHTVRRITSGGVVTTIGGKAGTAGSADGLNGISRFTNPLAVAVEPSGGVYVTDAQGTRIRRIGSDGAASRIGGNGTPGWKDSATGVNALFDGASGLAVDNNGLLYVADTNNQVVRRLSPSSNYQTSTWAGVVARSGDDNGFSSSARFLYPDGIAVDASGNVWLTDANHTIRRITPAGIVETFAGATGVRGSQNGNGTFARFAQPAGIAIDASGNLFIADSGNARIRKMALDLSVTTFAGSSRGNVDGSAANAKFANPVGIAIDSHGDVFVSDADNSNIRRIDASGNVTTFATGLHSPGRIAFDANDNLYVADTLDHSIRKITPAGVVTTLAGNGTAGSADGIGAAARFSYPIGVAVDAFGNVYVTDTGNATIRRIKPDGATTTVAGFPEAPGNVNGPALAARFAEAFAIAVDRNGRLIIADTANHAIRAGTFSAPQIASFAASPASIRAGETARLSWSVTDAVNVTIDHGVGTVAAAGSVNVTPSTTTTYRLTATGAGGTVIATTTVTIAGSTTQYRRRTSRP
jgi:DNA-binding beta-propeller fold protein YncE